MNRYIQVNCDVDVALCDIDDDDLQAELEERNAKRGRPATSGLTDFEALILRQRIVADLQRQATVGALMVTPAIREYFARVYGIDI